MKTIKKKRRKNRIQFTKKAMTGILVVALFDMQLPFVLAFLGREQIAEELGKVIALEIVGCFLVYCCKSFFETKEENKREVIDDDGIDITADR